MRLGHVKSMEEGRTMTRVAIWMPESKKKSASLRRRWRYAVMADLKEKDIRDWESKAKER